MKTPSLALTLLVLTGAGAAWAATSVPASRTPSHARGPGATSGQLVVEVCSRPVPHREHCIGVKAEEATGPSTSAEVTERFYDSRSGQDGFRWASCVFPTRSLLATTKDGAAIDLVVREPACSRGGTIRDVGSGELTEWVFPEGMRAQAYMDNPRFLTRLVSSVTSTDTVLRTTYRERCVSYEGSRTEGELTVGRRSATFNHATGEFHPAYYVHRSCRVVSQ